MRRHNRVAVRQRGSRVSRDFGWFDLRTGRHGVAAVEALPLSFFVHNTGHCNCSAHIAE